MWLDGDELCYRAAKGALTPELRSKLQDRKQQIVETLHARVRLEPASFSQQRLWFLDRLEPSSVSYTMALALHCSGHVNVDVLEASLDEVVRRHEVLRTTFRDIEGEPCQVIHPMLPISIERYDLTALEPGTRFDAALKQAEQVARTPFDLVRGPLLKAACWTLAEDDYLVLLPIHHSVGDGWSLSVILHELGLIYTARCRAVEPQLPADVDNFAAHALWEREWVTQPGYRKQLEFWKTKLSKSLPLLALPADRKRPAVLAYQGTLYRFSFTKEESDRIRAFSRQNGLTPFMCMLGAYFILLHRYTGQDDLVVGTPVAGRTRPGTRFAVGFFANTLALRAKLDNDPAALAFLRQVKRLTLEAIENQSVPFEKLVEEIHPERSSSHAPIFQTMFVFQNTPLPEAKFEGFTYTPLLVDSGMTKFDVTLSVSESRDVFHCNVEYSTELFDEATIIQLMEHYRIVLNAVIEAPETTVSALPMLTEAERRIQLEEWNATRRDDFRPQCAHRHFEAQARATPDAPAIDFLGHTMTYRELDRRANILARRLAVTGATANSIVGICLDRSPEMVVAVLAVMKAGAAYLPLDPAYPAERIRFMLDDAKPVAVVTSRKYDTMQAHHVPAVVVIDSIDSETADSSPLEVDVSPDSLAYVIYTSGSTGQPKGALLEHRGLSNLVQVMHERFGGGPGRRILQFCSFSFDASVSEIFLAIGTGGTLVLAPSEVLGSGPALIQLLRDAAVTTLSIPPSALRALPVSDLPALDTILTGGEPCPQELVQAWGSGRRFFNCYGPTEATVTVTVHERQASDDSSTTIGRPIDNAVAYILDEHQHLLPVGAAGELYIGGVQVARGYLNRDELTRRHFVRDPFSTAPGARLYRTGDRVRYRRDGTIEFLGRVDEQVKIRGFRIEPGEIEHVLLAHPEISQAVVNVLNGRGDEKRLVAYVVGKSRGEIAGLDAFVRDRLPSHMLPSSIVMLDALPLTPNGKIDRAALPMPAVPASEAGAIAPRNETEATIAVIWCELLSIDTVSVTSNFFELGGHSLLAMRLLSRLKESFGVEVPLRGFFETPTIEGAARLVHALRTSGKGNGHAGDAVPQHALPVISGANHHMQSLVAIQSHGTNPPLFLAAPAGGVVFPYYHLAPYLGDEQPLYALQDPGLDEHCEPFGTVEELAAHYIDAMKLVQPRGPYMLGGWSFGGTVAFEMAQQLSARGEFVSLLLMLDTQGTDMRPPAERRFTAILREAMGHMMDGLRLLPATMPYVYEGLWLIAKTSGKARTGEREASVFDYVRWAWSDLLMRRAGIPTEMTRDSALDLMRLPTFRRVMKTLRANGQTLFKYAPKPYPGKVTLFRATEQPPMRKGAHSRTLDWDCYARGGVEVFDVETNHVALMKPPAIEQVARLLRACIAKASAKP